jgi:hypothetical protein
MSDDFIFIVAHENVIVFYHALVLIEQSISIDWIWFFYKRFMTEI